MEISIKPYGLILAAGASSRMGFPKSLLSKNGVNLLTEMMARLSPFCRRVVVVGGAHIQRLRDHVPPEQLIHAPDWRRGMRSSLRAGLSVLPPGPVLMTHVDRPDISKDTLEHLIRAHGVRPTIPQYRAQAGHPIIIPQYLRTRLMKLDDTPLRNLLKKNTVDTIETNDKAVIRNINLREDWARFRAT